MPFSDPQSDSYRLALVCGDTRRLLLENLSGDERLPLIRVPRWTRAAQQVTRLIEQNWALKGIVLDFLSDRPGGGGLVLVESCSAPRSFSSRYRWAALCDLKQADVTDDELTAIEHLITSGGTGRGPFSRLRWIEEATAWVKEVTHTPAQALPWKIEQLNASATCSLLRLEDADGKAYWFKASGTPNSREAEITNALSSLFPSYVPTVIAFHPGWRAWLMQEEGVSLSSTHFSQEHFTDVAYSLAALQKASTQHISQLLAIGCHDHRMAALRRQLPELTPCLEEAARGQDVHTEPRISASRIRKIRLLVEEAATRLEDIGIPNTLMHCDFSLENILMSRRGPLFTDWAQASVGNPFVTFEQLRLQLSQHAEPNERLPAIIEVYRRCWSDLIPKPRIDRAVTLLPLIAAASNLCCRGELLTSSAVDRPLSHSYARILARQLDRAAQTIEANMPTTAWGPVMCRDVVALKGSAA